MKTYQSLRGYTGSLYAGAPEYTGMEYDYEVPDNLVVSSPGGVSTTHHHYTKGMYGDGASSWDIYGGEGYAYPSAEHGNLYQVGQSAPYYMGMYRTPPDVMYTANQSTAHRDNFTEIEMIPAPDSKEGFSPATGEKASLPEKLTATDLDPSMKNITHKIVLPNPWAMLVILLLAYIALDFWANAGESFIVANFNGGKPLSWKMLVLYAVILTVIVVVIAMVVKTPLLAVERHVV